MTLRSRCSSATFLRRFHGWMTVAWALLLVPSVLWWRESLAWIVLMSVWANLAGHFSSWQAALRTLRQYERDTALAADAKGREADRG